jgi:L-ascorbate metabolism protein UlaG (beta-lactamase superfamily)
MVRRTFIVILLALSACAPHYQSAQWSAGRFHNLPGWANRGGMHDFFRWQRTRPPAGDFVPPFVKNDGSRVRANLDQSGITWIGHATFLLQSGGANVLTDPVFSSDLGGAFPRYAPPGLALADLPPIDAVVISHNHRDHLDEDTVARLGDKPTYVVPLGLGGWFKRRHVRHVVELDWWQSTEIATRNGSIRVTLVPAQHWSARLIHDRNHTLWGGYVLAAGGKQFYFAGDTGFPRDGELFAEIGRRFPGLDFALLPIGAYAPRWYMSPMHMAPDQAAHAFELLGAKTLVPMHWATFHLSDEPMDEPPRALYEAMGARKNAILFLPIGGSYFSSSGKLAAE